MRLEESENLFANINILAYVIVAPGIPAFEKSGSSLSVWNTLIATFVIGSIERRRGTLESHAFL